MLRERDPDEIYCNRHECFAVATHEVMDCKVDWTPGRYCHEHAQEVSEGLNEDIKRGAHD